MCLMSTHRLPWHPTPKWATRFQDVIDETFKLAELLIVSAQDAFECSLANLDLKQSRGKFL